MRRRSLSRVLPFLFAAIAYLAMAMQAINEPGLYLDAINPDYLAVRLAHPHADIGSWILPGNLLWGWIPVLAGALYHGSLQAYTTLPFFLALGGSILSVRLAHIALALAVLGCTCLVVRRATGSALVAGIVACVLAVDPAFVLTWRTHAHITTFPICFVLLALWLLIGALRPRNFFLAGVLCGFAGWGYFINLFPLPGLAVLALFAKGGRWRSAVCLAAGVLVGFLPYEIGYALIFKDLGIGPGLAWLHRTLASQQINLGEAYAERVMAVLRFAVLGMSGAWHEAKIWGEAAVPAAGQVAKLACGLILAGLALPFARRAPGFAIPAIALASFLAAATVFGGRLGPHHFEGAMVLGYVVASAAAAVLLARFPSRHVAGGLFGVAAVLAAANMIQTQRLLDRLATHGGNGLFSDVISEYPRLALARGDTVVHLFGDWGSMMPFIYLTEGRIRAFDADDVSGVVCREGIARLVLTGADTTSRRDALLQGTPVVVDHVETLYDRHSNYPYAVATLQAKPGGC